MGLQETGKWQPALGLPFICCWKLGCLSLLGITSRAATNGVPTLPQVPAFALRGTYPGTELLGHMVIGYLIREEPPNSFPFSIPSSKAGGFQFLHTLLDATITSLSSFIPALLAGGPICPAQEDSGGDSKRDRSALAKTAGGGLTQPGLGLPLTAT